jgi:hypothetical protein
VIRGRALRCWGIGLALWVGGRVLWLWPREHERVERIAALAGRHPGGSALAHPLAPPPRGADERQPIDRSAPRPSAALIARAVKDVSFRRDATAAAAMLQTASEVSPPASARDDDRIVVTPEPLMLTSLPPLDRDAVDAPAAPRWSQSGWMFLRATGPARIATPQLGGSQLGVRLARAVTATGRVTASVRLVSTLEASEREAIGALEWRPTAIPVRLLVERRFDLAGSQGGWGVGAAGGLDEVVIGGDCVGEAYAQAGAIERRGGYVDGAIGAERRIGLPGHARLGLGLGAWGAAQRGAARLDLGPTATIRLGAARATLAWRTRVAGTARPGSGLALTIGVAH